MYKRKKKWDEYKQNQAKHFRYNPYTPYDTFSGSYKRFWKYQAVIWFIGSIAYTYRRICRTFSITTISCTSVFSCFVYIRWPSLLLAFAFVTQDRVLLGFPLQAYIYTLFTSSSTQYSGCWIGIRLSIGLKYVGILDRSADCFRSLSLCVSPIKRSLWRHLLANLPAGKTSGWCSKRYIWQHDALQRTSTSSTSPSFSKI